MCVREVSAVTPKKDRREYFLAYNAANHEKRKAYRQVNRERIRAYLKKYQLQNPEKVREAKRSYGLRHPERKSDTYRRWRRNNPDKALQNDHRRRARLRAAKGTFTLAEWESLKRAYLYTCLACKLQEPEVKLVPDHVIPLACGGANDVYNIQPLCERCNKRKGAKTVDYRDGREWSQALA
jgi:5-methylcytosine-specific restriction endonuclease McrA